MEFDTYTKWFLALSILLLPSTYLSFHSTSLLYRIFFLVLYAVWIVLLVKTSFFSNGKKEAYQKLFSVYYLIMNLVFWVSALFLTLQKYDLLPMFFLVIISIMILNLAVFFLGMMCISRWSIWFLVPFYIGFVILVILTFAGFYASIENTPRGTILEYGDYSSLTIGDYAYFSGLVFYTSSMGDFMPAPGAASARFIVLIEVGLSFILHVVFLGWLFSRKD